MKKANRRGRGKNKVGKGEGKVGKGKIGNGNGNGRKEKEGKRIGKGYVERNTHERDCLTKLSCIINY
jgi:hypothetical protein